MALRKVAFDADLDGWLSGLPVQLTLDLLYLGKPKKVTVPWTFARPGSGQNAQNVQKIVAQLAPVEEFERIAKEYLARVARGLAQACE